MERHQAGLDFFQSNDFDTLLDRLLGDLLEGGDDPFQPEVIIVPGTAMRRVVEQRYASRAGIAANFQFDFLARWIWGRIGSLLPDTRESPLRNPRLLWQVYRAFGEPEFQEGNTRLAHYLACAKQDPVMRFELAGRVAGIYQRCLPWREDWIRRWSQGDTIGLKGFADEDWLAALWRWLARELKLPTAHPATAFMQALEALTPDARGTVLPPRLSVFCPAELPPLYLDLLRDLARFIRIHVYLFNPCRQYWSLIVEQRRLARLEAREQAQYHEVGHPLLASWGQETQGVFAQIEKLDEISTPAEEGFQIRTAASLLAWVQNDILDLGAAPPHCARAAGDTRWLPEADTSLEVHVCHSFTRQLEVLHDRLLARFEAEPRLCLSDVVVVMPDLDSRAPLIDAVFGSVPRERMIPYRITGQRGRRANPAVDALLSVFSLIRSRCRASEVFAVLRQRIVAARLELSHEALDALHDWMRRSDMRWGLDATHRVSVGQPDDETCTLIEGLDRLFLGLAMPEEAGVWHGILPVPQVEGSITAALGVLWQFVTHLAEARDFVAHDQTVSAWERFCDTWAQRILSDDREWVDEVRAVRATLRQCFETLHAARLEDPLPFSVLLASLTESFEEGGRAALISPVLNFVPMNAVRFLPFQIVCVLGLEDDAFPSGGRVDEFDPMGVQPRLGDPIPRLTARNLFLDLLLAAREQLYLSYTGRSLRDDEPLPPSIVLSDLFDCIASRWSPELSQEEVRRRIEIIHPLQAFSRRYFGSEPQLFSHVSEYADGLSAATHADRGTSVGSESAPAGAADEVFCSAPLSPSGRKVDRLSLTQLGNFLGNPSRHFLQQRLGMRFGLEEEELTDEEPDSVGERPQRALARRLWSLLVRGTPSQILEEHAQAGREQPPDAIGRVRIKQVCDTLLALQAQRIAQVGTGAPQSLYFEYRFKGVGGGCTLEGLIDEVMPAGRMVVLPTRCYVAQLLSAWVFHLAYQLAVETTPTSALPVSSRATFLLSAERYITSPEALAEHSDKKAKTKPRLVFKQFKPVPVDEAARTLESLIARYQEGLTRPLPFFPRAAKSFIEGLNSKPGSRTKSPLTQAQLLATARKDALVTWMSNHPGAWPEVDDLWHAQAIQGVPAEARLDEEFEALAQEIFSPVRASLAEDVDAEDAA